MAGNEQSLILQLEVKVAREKARGDLLERQAERLSCELKAAEAEKAELRRALKTETVARAKLIVAHEDLQARHNTLQAKVDRLGEFAKQCMRRMYGPRSERRTLHPEGQQTMDVIAEHLAELAALYKDPSQTDATDDTEPTAGPAVFPNDDAPADAAPADDTTADASRDADDDTADAKDGTGTGDSASEQKSNHQRPPNAGGRNGKPAGLEEIRETYQAPPDHPELRNALEVAIIGTGEMWDLDGGHCAPVIRTIGYSIARITYVNGSTSIVRLTPPKVIPRGGCSDRLLVSSAMDKVADHLPAYRQEKRHDRTGLTLPRSKLTRWHISLATFLSSLSAAILEETLQYDVLGVDDTVHRLLEGCKGAARQSRLWIVQAKKNSYYLFSETREAKWILNLLEDYSGTVMGDAYSGNELLFKREDIVPLLCWAHVRRKFFEAADTKRAAIMLALIGQLYDIERTTGTLSPEERRFRRPAQAKPILALIKRQLDVWADDQSILPQSGIGQATAYAHKRWAWLERYCTIDNAAIDNNAAERSMRPNALHRKNSLFSATIKGAESYATLSTVIQTAMNHDLNPEAYLLEVIQDIHYDRRPIHELTPAAYVDRRKSACEKCS